MRLLQKARLQTKINPRISDIAGKIRNKSLNNESLR